MTNKSLYIHPEENGCMLKCGMCMCYKIRSCTFGILFMKKARQIKINVDARTKRKNLKYGYNTNEIDILTVRELLRKTLLNRCVCVYCKQPMIFPNGSANNPQNISIEHIIPLSDGGTNEIDNLTMCHLGCNTERDRLYNMYKKKEI